MCFSFCIRELAITHIADVGDYTMLLSEIKCLILRRLHLKQNYNTGFNRGGQKSLYDILIYKVFEKECYNDIGLILSLSISVSVSLSFSLSLYLSVFVYVSLFLSLSLSLSLYIYIYIH